MPNGLRIEDLCDINVPVFMFVCIHFKVPPTRITDLVRNYQIWYGTVTFVYTLHNVCAVHRGCAVHQEMFSTPGWYHWVHRGIFSTLEIYRWVHWGDIMSTPRGFQCTGDTMSTTRVTMISVGDIMSTAEEGVQYTRGIPWLVWANVFAFSTWFVFSQLYS